MSMTNHFNAVGTRCVVSQINGRAGCKRLQGGASGSGVTDRQEADSSDATQRIPTFVLMMSRLSFIFVLLATFALMADDFHPPLQTTEGFAVPQPGRVFTFPRDHGSHPEFNVEWWYVTGHLFAEDGRRFGYQATFFRQASKGDGPENPLFQHRQMYLTHMAFLDVKTGRFLHQERVNRGGWDADSSLKGLDVFNGNWSLKMDDAANNHLTLHGSATGDAAFDLQLKPSKPLVMFGENGVSRKASLPTAASHYLTFPRLTTEGTVRIGDQTLKVHGESWMDHEISSSQLSPEQIGWDWAAIQLKDGRELMVYRMRLKSGGVDPFSTLAWIDAAGGVKHSSPDHFSWKERGFWQSKVTQARYPVHVEITTNDPMTQKPVSLRLEPLAEAQEQTGALGGTAYWEGACRVLDDQGKDIGSSFLELTGYSGDLSAKFK